MGRQFHRGENACGACLPGNVDDIEMGHRHRLPVSDCLVEGKKARSPRAIDSAIMFNGADRGGPLSGTSIHGA